MTNNELELQLIAKHERELEELMKPVRKKWKFINDLCESIDLPPKYSLEGESAPAPEKGCIGVIRNDQWTGKPLATAVEEFMNMRRDANPSSGAPTLEEIYRTLLLGGYQFNGRTEKDQQHSLATTLGKNTAKFRKIAGPNGELFGLQKWYGGAKTSKSKLKDGVEASTENDGNSEIDTPETIDQSAQPDESTEESMKLSH